MCTPASLGPDRGSRADLSDALLRPDPADVDQCHALTDGSGSDPEGSDSEGPVGPALRDLRRRMRWRAAAAAATPADCTAAVTAAADSDVFVRGSGLAEAEARDAGGGNCLAAAVCGAGDPLTARAARLWEVLEAEFTDCGSEFDPGFLGQ